MKIAGLATEADQKIWVTKFRLIDKSVWGRTSPIRE